MRREYEIKIELHCDWHETWDFWIINWYCVNGHNWIHKKIYFALFFCAAKTIIVVNLSPDSRMGMQTVCKQMEFGVLHFLVILIRKLYKQFMPLSQFFSLPSLHIHCACDQQIRLPWIELEIVMVRSYFWLVCVSFCVYMAYVQCSTKCRV